MTRDSSSGAGPAPIIFGCAGPALGSAEAAFFRDADPEGFILFARNVETPDQVRALVADLRAAVGRAAPVLIDQEGGRVQRLRAPEWRDWPWTSHWIARVAAGQWSEAMLRDALALRACWIAEDLADIGVDVCCAPLLDVARPETHAIIADRALGDAPASVAARGRAVLGGLAAGGVAGVIKHMPGHGRAVVDSHERTPRVSVARETLLATDFDAFRRLADAPYGMTAHVVFDAIDPDRPATLSSAVVEDAIRGEIGFRGALLTDDLSMGALQGAPASSAAAALRAGCDLALHCNGDLAEMEAIAAAAPAPSVESRVRIEAARRRPERRPFDRADAAARLAALEAAGAPE